MAKGFFTQGVAVLFRGEPSLSSLAPLLGDFRIVKEARTASGWEMGDASLIVEYDAAVNGYVSVDVVNRPWPDHMGDPQGEPALFAAWSMGYFGPYTYPRGLERATRQSWRWKEAGARIAEHASFARLKMSYVFGAADDAPVMPEHCDPLKELDFLTAMAARLLAHPAAICYFNPNGEVILTGQLLDESARHHKSHDLPALDLWTNVRLFDLDSQWHLMDSVGAWQLDVADQEAAFPRDRFEPREVDEFIRNATLYILKNGPVIEDGDTMDGPGGIRWQARTFRNGLNDPPRQTLRWLPTGIPDAPALLLEERPDRGSAAKDGASGKPGRKSRLLWLAIVACLAVGVAAVILSRSDPAPAGKTGTTQWVDPATLKPGPIRREQLSAEQLKRIAAVREMLGDVDTSPLEQWVDDFKRDADPDRELAIWEAMARAYVRCTADRNWPLEKRKELFGILLVGSGAPPDEALAHLKLKTVSEAEAREALGALAEDWKKRPDSSHRR